MRTLRGMGTEATVSPRDPSLQRVLTVAARGGTGREPSAFERGVLAICVGWLAELHGAHRKRTKIEAFDGKRDGVGGLRGPSGI